VVTVYEVGEVDGRPRAPFPHGGGSGGRITASSRRTPDPHAAPRPSRTPLALVPPHAGRRHPVRGGRAPSRIGRRALLAGCGRIPAWRPARASDQCLRTKSARNRGCGYAIRRQPTRSAADRPRRRWSPAGGKQAPNPEDIPKRIDALAYLKDMRGVQPPLDGGAEVARAVAGQGVLRRFFPRNPAPDLSWPRAVVRY
jgi:hypothetical protein